MSLPAAGALGASAALANPARTADETHASVEAQKLKKAAGDFESILLASMWKSMKQSFGSAEAESDPAHGTLDDWGIEIMSGAVGKAGGLGIGRLILEHLAPKIVDSDVAPPETGSSK